MSTLVASLVFVLGSALCFDPERDLEAARRGFRSGDMDQAMRLARRAAFFGDDDGAALHLVARAAERLGRPGRARDVLDRLLVVHPEHARALLFRGELRMEGDDLNGALSDLNRGLTLVQNKGAGWPRSMAGYLARRGMVLHDLGKREEALRDLTTAMSMGGKDPWPHLLASRIFEDRGRFMEALQEHEKGLVLLRARNRNFFLVPKYGHLTRRLVYLRSRAGVPESRPILPGLN
jgi:tetratricopeptide (TPR) repeat protein